MKKIIFTAYSLEIGGIERSLISLLKTIDYNKYDVTLLLEKKQGVLLNQIPSLVKVLEYKISDRKFIPLRKVINRLKLLKMLFLNYHGFDFACCYAPYSIPGSILTRYFSKNNTIWIHTDYYALNHQDIDKTKAFFNSRKIHKFNKIIFVSNEAKNHFLDLYKNLETKLLVYNNLIDYKEIEKQASAKILENKPKKPLFINISRHEEQTKKIMRIINASKRLIDEGHDFEVWLIGDGDSKDEYEKKIKEFNLDNNIKLLGYKSNPYPYYKIADAYILTSDYEGFPVVFIESLIFNLPIITTINVSNDSVSIKDNYGIVVDKNDTGVYEGMKTIIIKGFKIKNKFDKVKYNNDIIIKLQKMFDNKEVK